MGKAVTAILLLVMIVSISGLAQSKPLTRPKAMAIIEQSAEFQNSFDNSYLRIPTAYNPSDRTCGATKELQLGVDRGYWTFDIWSGTGELKRIIFTGKAKPLFRPELEFNPICIPEGPNGAWKFFHALRRHIVAVTGITGDDQNKNVELLWMPDLNSFPADLRELFPAQAQLSFRSSVDMRLYDDGWRAIHVSYQ